MLAHGLAPDRPEISAYIRWNEDAVASGTFGKLGHGNREASETDAGFSWQNAQSGKWKFILRVSQEKVIW